MHARACAHTHTHTRNLHTTMSTITHKSLTSWFICATLQHHTKTLEHCLVVFFLFIESVQTSHLYIRKEINILFAIIIIVKVPKWIIFNKFYTLLESHQVLSDAQFGFQVKHSTISLLLTAVNDWESHLNN